MKNRIESFRNNLAPHNLVYVDTPCFIYHLERNLRYFKIVNELFTNLSNKKITTSTLTLMEVLSSPEIAHSKGLLAQTRVAFLSIPGLEILKPEIFLSEDVAILRNKYNLSLVDSIHLTSALHTNSTLLITNDRKFIRVKELEVLVLEDFV